MRPEADYPPPPHPTALRIQTQLKCLLSLYNNTDGAPLWRRFSPPSGPTKEQAQCALMEHREEKLSQDWTWSPQCKTLSIIASVEQNKGEVRQALE